MPPGIAVAISALPPSLRLDEDVVPIDPHGELRDAGFGEVGRVSLYHVELPEVPGAAHHRAVEDPLAERPSLVRADAIHRMEDTPDVEQRDPAAVGDHRAPRA